MVLDGGHGGWPPSTYPAEMQQDRDGDDPGARGKILPFRTRSERSIRVLVLDEQPSLRQLLRAMLERGQTRVFDVLESATVEAAVDLIQQPATRPHVLLVDLMLEGSFRVEVIREIRTRSNAPSLPIAVVSGRRAPDDLLRARMAGADAFLPKPFSGSDLLPMVVRLAGESPESVGTSSSHGDFGLT